MQGNIPIPHSVQVIRPSYMRHHVKLDGLFKETLRRFNDTSDVTDDELAAYKAKQAEHSVLNNTTEVRATVPEFKLVSL